MASTKKQAFLSVKDSARNYLLHLKNHRKLERNTVFHYGHDLLLFIKFVGHVERKSPSKIDIKDISQKHVIAFLDNQTHRRKNKASSNRRRLACLRGFFRYMSQKGEQKPILIPFPTQKEKPPAILSEDEITDLLRASRSSAPNPIRDYAILCVFLYCGCRLSELLRLNTDDVNFDKEYICFYHSDGTERYVPLSVKVQDALKAYMSSRPKSSSSRLFLNRYYRPITKGAVYHSFYKCLYSAGIRRQEITIHSLRQTFLVSLLHEGKLTRDQVQDIAGTRCEASIRPYLKACDQLREDRNSYKQNRKKKK